MVAEIGRIDRTGRVQLPIAALDALGIQPGDEIVIEVTAKGLLITTSPATSSITERIAAMNLSADEWEDMEREIGAGRLA